VVVFEVEIGRMVAIEVEFVGLKVLLLQRLQFLWP
jgi:hypothetical protein